MAMSKRQVYCQHDRQKIQCSMLTNLLVLLPQRKSMKYTHPTLWQYQKFTRHNFYNCFLDARCQAPCIIIMLNKNIQGAKTPKVKKGEANQKQQLSVFTSGIAYNYPYSQHFEAKCINRKPTSAWCLFSLLTQHTLPIQHRSFDDG